MSPDSSRPVDRREFASTAAGVVATVWLAARPSDLAAAFRADEQEPSRFLTAPEAADLEAIVSRIVPSDETPGAKEAGIVGFIDRALITFAADQQALVRTGLGDLRARAAQVSPGKTFAALGDSEQIDLLQALERNGSDFFEAVRVATIVGMFANPSYGGNRNKIGWRLIGFEDRFLWQPPFGEYDRPEPPR